jgi:hypothetical protein
MPGNGEGTKMVDGQIDRTLGGVFKQAEAYAGSEEPVERDVGDTEGVRVDPTSFTRKKRATGWHWGRDANGKRYKIDGDGDETETEPQSDTLGRRKKTEALVIALSELTEILGFVHLSLAATFKSPELVLKDDECERLANSVSKVLRHYTIPLASQKTKDWFMLGIVAWGIYKPRISDISVRKHEQRKKAMEAAKEALQHAQVSPAGPLS